MARIINSTRPVNFGSIENDTSGTYLLNGSKIIELSVAGGVLNVKELYDINYTPYGKIPPALRPTDIAKLWRYFAKELRKEPENILLEKVTNPGKYSGHPALAMVERIKLPMGEVDIETKRYRLDKALNGEYSCPVWLLWFIEANSDGSPLPCENEIAEDYLVSLLLKPYTVRDRRPRPPRAPRTPRTECVE